MYFDRAKYKNFARQQLKGRRKNATLAVLVVVIISLLFSIPETRLNYSWKDMVTAANSSFTDFMDYIRNTNNNSILASVFSIIESLVTFITSIALASFFLAYSRSPEPVALKSFFEGFNKWGRGILAGLWQSLWYFVWLLVCSFAALIIITPILIVTNDPSLSSSLVTLLLLVAFITIIVIKAIEYSHQFYLVAEFPELGIRKALRISILITRGHRADIFLTHLTFIGYSLLSFITLGLAQIWYKPYTEMTFINIYHALLKDALENGKLNPEDLN